MDWGLGGWLHRFSEAGFAPGRVVSTPETTLTPSRKKASPTILDLTYRFLIGEHPLQSAHVAHLQSVRKLRTDQIARLAYATWGPEKHSRRRVARLAWEQVGQVVLDVPGVIVRNQTSFDFARDYLTLGGPSGLLIPVRDVEGRIVAAQVRADKPKAGARYVWLSSAHRGGASPGAPVHVSRPFENAGSGRVWVTEGPLKADIACAHLQEVVLAMAGVGADKDLLPTLQALRERGEVREVVLALDMDYLHKPQVARARKKLAEKLARAGHPVWLAEWPEALKGLDDLLLAGGKPKLKPYRVCGTGPRQFEVVDSPPREKPREKVMSLDQARQYQTRQMSDFLLKRRGENGELGLLVRSQPGTGKSHSATTAINKLLSKQARRRVAIFVSRHDLSEAKDRTQWAKVRGRTHTGPGKSSPPCSFPDRQNKLASLRISGQVGCEQCPLLNACRTNTQQAAGQPFYHAQFHSSKRVTVFPAQHFLTPSRWQYASALVLDDCDLRNLALEEVSLKREDLEYALSWCRRHPQSPYSGGERLLERILEVWSEAPAGERFHWHSEELLEKLGDLAEPLKQTASLEEPHPFEGGLGWEDTERLQIPKRFLRELRDVLNWEYQAWKSEKRWNPRLRFERRFPQMAPQLQLTLRRDLPLDALAGKPLVLLDASLSLEEAERLFPDRRWKVVDPPLALPKEVEVIQYPGRLWGKTSLSRPAAQEDALAEIGRLVEQHQAESIGLITHHSFAALVKQRFPQLKVGHYYGQRGSNEFENCSVLICFGTPNPNPQDMLNQARALYWDASPLLELEILEGRTFDVSPGTESVRTRVRSFADPRLREILESRRDEELRQAVFRVRPLSVQQPPPEQGELFDEPGLKTPTRARASIYIFSSVPLPGLLVSLQPREIKPEQTEPEDPERQRVVSLCERSSDRGIAERKDLQRKPLRGSTPPAHGPPSGVNVATSN